MNSWVIPLGPKHFDCIVLGGGSGGIAFARRAAAYGARVALVECGRLGGTCVNVGCVPKKVMWNAANAYEVLHGLKHLGIDMGEGGPRLCWERLVENREKYIKRLNAIYDANLKKANVERFKGWGRLAGRFHAGQAEGREQKEAPDRGAPASATLVARHVLIATGKLFSVCGRPTPLSIPGGSRCTDSDGFFALRRQPKRAGVVGAGYIAVELSGVLQALGTETHLFVRGETALRKFDCMIQQQNHKNLTALGVTVHPHSVPVEVSAAAGGEDSSSLCLRLEGGERHGPFDCVIQAVGRSPEVEGLGLEKAGVRLLSPTKHIQTDEFQNTNVEGIFAVGDVCGAHVELTPMAIAAGRRLADRLYGQLKSAKADYNYVPTVIFAHPPIATVGLTEQQAKEQYGEDAIKLYEGSSVNLLYGPYDIPPEEKPKTHIKLICNKKDKERILGLHIVGMGADEMMQGFATAIKMGATKADFDNCVAIHPTAAEEVVTLPPWGLSGISP
ncbi:hypothetical protein Efla_005937 [Eimeria flavescens]